MCNGVRVDGSRSASGISELAHAAPAFAACFDAGPGSRVGPAVARGCQEGTLKLWNSIMSGLLLAPLALAGCPTDDTDETGAGSTTEPGTTTNADSTTTAVAESSSGMPTTGEDTGPPPSCDAPQEIPPAPVDCSTATGEIMGHVLIEEGGDDPSILEGVVRVTGSVQINGTTLTDLNFMACLQEVGENVTIYDNDQLTNVDGLWSLTNIGTDFIFSQNDALVDFNGLPNAAKIVNNLVLNENGSMQQISGFHSLVGIDGMGIDPETMTQIGGNVTIQQNPVLENIDGLIGLLVVNGVFAVTNNPMLCISSVVCVGEGIQQPAEPPDSWSTVGNDNEC
jgi:hypothetical protein